MGDKEKLISEEAESLANVQNQPKKVTNLPCYMVGGFLVFWVLLFFAVVIPLFYRLPTALTLEDAESNEFIAERAYSDLYTLSNIGKKVAGTEENEVLAVEFLMNELEKIKKDALKEFFDFEIDLSQATGQFVIGIALRAYQGVQNIAVKLSPKNSTSQNYLLVNSHFDSQGGPGAGDAGFMIAVMLEVLRVMATTRQSFDHPIVFLFNGAEESGLSASHGFITQHKWAPNCKTVINLDAAGSGGRELLFQEGPNNPWLLKYYKKFIKHPLATVLAEDTFKAGIMPSDTDFRQFKNFGKLTGLDLAQITNGYIYHTKYDRIEIIPRESFQNTGDNVLSLVRGFSNVTELYDTEAHKEENSVFFDFLGLYFFHYTEATGILINFSVAGAALLLVIISMIRMASVSKLPIRSYILRFIMILVIQVVCIALAFVLPMGFANLLDSMDNSMTYYSNTWLIIGLYVCPSLIGLSLPFAIYYSLQRNGKIPNGYHVQLSLHSYAIVLAGISIWLTLMGVRSAYLFVIPVMFYAGSLALNLMTTLHDLGYAWTALVKVGQIIPFMYSSYVCYTLLTLLIPMCGRGGGDVKRDLFIAFYATIGTILSFGFLIALINTFRRRCLIILGLIVITALSTYLATNTQVGFPYRPKTSGQRVAYLNSRSIFYEYDGSIISDESGYLFMYQDRRRNNPLFGNEANVTGIGGIESKCQNHMMCGLPLINSNCLYYPTECSWLPRSDPVEIPRETKLKLLNKTIISPTTVRFEFNLTGPADIKLFIQPYEDVSITKWSFLQSYLDKPIISPRPYIIYFKYGANNSPFNFYVECTKSTGNFNVPLFQLGVSSQYITYESDLISKKFASTFPPYAILDQWPALYQRYIF